MPRYRRLLALLLPGILPWGVVTWPTGYYLVFAVGWSVGGLSDFRTLPTILEAGGAGASAAGPWLAGTILYVASLAAAALAAVDREDRRLTAGLLFLAGASVLLFALRSSAQRGILVVPVGVLTLWAAAIYAYEDRVPWLSRVRAWGGNRAE